MRPAGAGPLVVPSVAPAFGRLPKPAALVCPEGRMPRRLRTAAAGLVGAGDCASVLVSVLVIAAGLLGETGLPGALPTPAPTFATGEI